MAVVPPPAALPAPGALAGPGGTLDAMLAEEPLRPQLTSAAGGAAALPAPQEVVPEQVPVEKVHSAGEGDGVGAASLVTMVHCFGLHVYCP
jgi:hypothetical protein